jgi:hypothetical protein
VIKEPRQSTLSVRLGRLIATSVSFALCLAYLLIFPFTGLGMAVVIGLGTIVMVLLDRREDIVTTGITTTVVLVAATRKVDSRSSRLSAHYVLTMAVLEPAASATRRNVRAATPS